jgi:hypothetical protein
LKNSFRITGLQDCNKRHTTPNFLSWWRTLLHKCIICKAISTTNVI